MSDFGLREAVDAAARATVAPPFGIVERRARARRHRAVAGVAAGVVAVLAVAAVAVPDGGPRTAAPLGPTPTPTPTALRPYADLANDPAAKAEIDACLAELEKTPSTFPDKMRGPTHRGICYPAAGYRPPTLRTIDGSALTENGHQCVNVPVRPRGDSRRIAQGAAAGRRWFVATWTSYIGSKCVGFGTDPQQETNFRVFVNNDTGLPGEFASVLTWAYLVGPRERSGPAVYWGAVPAEVVRVEIPVGDETVRVETVPGEDRAYLGVLLDLPDGVRPAQATGYDAAGAKVELPRTVRS